MCVALTWSYPVGIAGSSPVSDQSVSSGSCGASSSERGLVGTSSPYLSSTRPCKRRWVQLVAGMTLAQRIATGRCPLHRRLTTNPTNTSVTLIPYMVTGS